VVCIDLVAAVSSRSGAVALQALRKLWIAETVQPLPSLPNGATANAVQVDTAGNIFVGGEFFPNPQNPNGTADAIVWEALARWIARDLVDCAGRIAGRSRLRK
jgi:hypothetical protein